MIDIIAENPWTALGLTLVGLTAYYYFDEGRDADDRPEAVEGVGERIDDLFGGIFGVIGALAVAGVSIGATIGGELARGLAGLIDVALISPAVSGELVTGLVAALGLSGVIKLDAATMLFVSVVIGLITVALQSR